MRVNETKGHKVLSTRQSLRKVFQRDVGKVGVIRCVSVLVKMLLINDDNTKPNGFYGFNKHDIYTL